MRLKNFDLLVTVFIAVLNMVWVLLPSHSSVIGGILALPLVLVLPGYTLTEALFHQRSLDASHRLVYSLGLSLVIDILSGLILNLLPIGLQEISWAMLLGLLTVAFSLLVAYLRFRRKVPMEETQQPKFRFTIYGSILFGLAIIPAFLAILYSAIGVAQQPHPGFTQLWTLSQVNVGKSCAVRLGVRSFESTSVTYLISMTMNGVEVATWPSFALASGGEWDRLVPLTPKTAGSVYVEVQLYRLDRPQTVYRKVDSTLNNCSTSQVTSTPYPGLTRAYNGTIYDIPFTNTTNMSLMGLQQNEGTISGYLTMGSGLQGSVSFKGMVTTTRHIQFTVTNSAGHTSISFDGSVQSDGTLLGTYCKPDQVGQCSGDYGLWSVIPASS